MRRLLARIARGALWTAIAFVILSGLLTLFGSHGASSDATTPRTTGPPAWPDDTARAYAAAFTRAYLTYQPRHPDAYQAAITRFLPTDAQTPTLPGKGHGQQVLDTQPDQIVRLDRSHALITIAALVQPGGWRYLVVPVARDSSGLVVNDAPSFAAPPGHGQTDSTIPDSLEDPGAQDITFVTGQFLRAYLAGDAASLAAWVKPGIRIRPLSPPMVMVGSPDVEQLGATAPRARAVIADAGARDRGGVVYPARYRVRLELGDRWYVVQVNGGSG